MTPVFSVTPMELVLGPGCVGNFSFSGISENPGEFLEEWRLVEIGGEGDKNAKGAGLGFRVKCAFVAPSLEFSKKILSFRYLGMQQDNEPNSLQEDLAVTNTSLLPVSFYLKCAAPFSVSSGLISLTPEESLKFQISFDLSISQADRKGIVTKSRLTAILANGTSLKENVELVGESQFPNLELESMIDFGAVINGTITEREISLKNVSDLPCEYRWGSRPNPQNLTCMFDIEPVFGTVDPRGSVTAKIRFSGMCPDMEISSLAVCAVRGGPQYEIVLKGETSREAFALEGATEELDFGLIHFDRWNDKELILMNLGKVVLNWTVNIDSEDLLRVFPASGSLKGLDKTVLKVSVRPGLPEEISGCITFEAGCCPSAEIRVKARGIFPALLIDLPREGAVVKRDTENLSISQIRASLSMPLSVSEAFALDMMSPSFIDELIEKDRLNVCMQIRNGESVISLNKKSSSTAPRFSTLSLLPADHLPTAGHYVLDFGYVPLGNSKTRSFTLRNPMTQVVRVEGVRVDRLSFLGFTLTPNTKEIKLLPSGCQVWTVTAFRGIGTDLNDEAEGEIEFRLKGGVRLLVSLKACFLAADIEILKMSETSDAGMLIGDEVLDFGRLIPGEVRVKYLWFYNPKPIPVEYSCRTDGVWSLSPQDGVIEPGKRVVVKVSFKPIFSGKISSNKITVRIKDGKVPRYFRVKGESERLKISLIDYQSELIKLPNLSIDFGPVLPGERKTRKFVLENESKRPVEVLGGVTCLVGATDEDLRINKWLDSQGLSEAFVPLRVPGKPLVLPQKLTESEDIVPRLFGKDRLNIILIDLKSIELAIKVGSIHKRAVIDVDAFIEKSAGNISALLKTLTSEYERASPKGKGSKGVKDDSSSLQIDIQRKIASDLKDEISEYVKDKQFNAGIMWVLGGKYFRGLEAAKIIVEEWFSS